MSASHVDLDDKAGEKDTPIEDSAPRTVELGHFQTNAKDGLIDESTLDPIYLAKAQVLNAAMQEIGEFSPLTV